MSDNFLIADDAAKRIVRHFQDNGFAGISEALIIRIRLREGSQGEIEAMFESALEQDKLPPVRQYFEIIPFGHFADFRSFAEARALVSTDFTPSLQAEIPKVFFGAAPVVIEDALASGTKYDVMMKLRDNVRGYAIAILLNDPDAAFIDYLSVHSGDDWAKIMGDFEVAAAAVMDEINF